MTHDHTKGPDLRVIDRAIERIKSGKDRCTVIALYGVLRELGGAEHRGTYSTQYGRFSWRNGKPRWWNSPHLHTRARIAALKAFRQACIDSAKEKK